MWVGVEPDVDVVRRAVFDAISAVLGYIHGLPHGLDRSEAIDRAVETILREGFYQP